MNRPRWMKILSTLRRIAGMPDYAAFAAHHRAHHPECALPSEREYFEQYLATKYGGGVNRCC